MNTDTRRATLVFTWPNQIGRSSALWTWILISLLAHTSSFFLFQVVPPSSATITPNIPHVSLLTPSSSSAIALLQWLDAQDAGLVAHSSDITELPTLIYQPSYVTIRTPLIGPTEASDSVDFPPIRDLLATIDNQAPPQIPPSVTQHPQSTSIKFAPELIRRSPVPAPFIAPLVRTTTPLNPSQYLIGVTDSGVVRFVFLQCSSGNSSFDDHGATFLQSLSFAPNPQPIVWEYAEVDWGENAYKVNPFKDAHPSSLP